MDRIRVLLADDQPAIFDGLRQILGPEYEIVGEVQDGVALLAAAVELEPDVIVLDVTMPRLGGIIAARRIKRALNGVQIVFLTTHTEEIYAEAAFKAGGSAFVFKSSAEEELVAAIRESLQGRKFLTRALTGALSLEKGGEIVPE